MKRQYRRRCPVCWQVVSRTSNDNIASHRDSVGRDKCPGSHQPYAITERRRSPDTYDTRLVNLAVRNDERKRQAAAVAVERAQTAVSVIISARPITTEDRYLQAGYLDVLTTRATLSHASLAECGVHLAMSKDAYAGRLRRAFEYAERRSA